MVQKRYISNEMIRAKEVRVIGSDNSQLGVMQTRDAIAKANDEGLDLVLISSDADPQVCRIADVGKLRYEQEKKEKKSRKGSRGGQLKEIKMFPKIGIHDFEVKAAHAKEFLEKRFKVKVTLQFRGREATHPEIGRRLIEKMVEYTADSGKPEGPVTHEGRSMIMILSPK